MNLGGHAAPGVLEHWVAVTAEGMYGVDGYESREVADHLAQQKIGPLVQELELPPPTSSDCEVDALLEPQN
jgi:hypothetical protein